MPTFVIVGASSGIGLEMVKQLAARGDKVFATCRSKAGSATGVDGLSEITGDITIIEGIDIAQDSVGEVLKASALADVPIDVIVHNAGSINGSRDVKPEDMFAEQKFANISMDRMRAAFEVNTLGPLRVQQALLPQMVSPNGKVAVISTGMGSIGDNGSGGIYAYRTSKAAVNMVTKSMSCDFKEKGISVMAIAPGIVVSDFGPGQEQMAKMGAAPVDKAVGTILQVIDGMNMENTGSYMMVPTNGSDPKIFPW
mmetsp:Transcript_83146/g.144490  ORF Transcript_83146/g.144490 Transcript_83146/m.144490 type:complete len:254 (+) Transcript_83146:80-841(+)